MKFFFCTITALISFASTSAIADTFHCSGSWAGVETIMPVTATVVTTPDGSSSPFSLVVNNGEFRGTMMMRDGLFAFNVRRVGSQDMNLTGNLKFLNVMSAPKKIGFTLHATNAPVEAILLCDPATQD